MTEESEAAAKRVKERVVELVASIAFNVASRHDMPTMTDRLTIELKLGDEKVEL